MLSKSKHIIQLHCRYFKKLKSGKFLIIKMPGLLNHYLQQDLSLRQLDQMYLRAGKSFENIFSKSEFGGFGFHDHSRKRILRCF